MKPRTLVDAEERPLPDTIWRCEHGHFDLVHRQSALDVCCTCWEGSCELLPTTVSGKRRRPRQYKGPTIQEVVVESKVTPLPLPEGFSLNQEQLEALAEGEHPGIAFPKTLNGSLGVGSRYAIDEQTTILITGIAEEKFAFGVFYEVIRAGEKVVADQFNPHADALPKAFRRLETTKSGTQTVGAESEPEPITSGDAQRMTDDTRAARIEEFRASLKEAEAHLANLEERHPDKPRLFWPVNEEIKRLSKELSTEENIARDLPLVASEAIT